MVTPRALDTVAAFLASRFPLSKVSFENLAGKSVPIHSGTWMYLTGGLTAFFFMIQLLTGILLIFYYQATITDAAISIHYIDNNVPNGSLIRNMHTWSSSSMILCAVIHLLGVFSMKAFAKPRELTWIFGVLLLFLTLGFGFTGYLLPWNQIAVNATKVALATLDQVAQMLPVVLSRLPIILKDLIQGDTVLGQATLSRFYALHVVLLPLTMLLFLGLHLLQVQMHGISQGSDQVPAKSERFFPLFLLRDLILWSVAFFLLFVVSLCLPFESFIPSSLLAPYNPLAATPTGIKPEWYFLFVYYPLELLPLWFVLCTSAIFSVGLFLVPWIFRKTSRRILSTIAIVAASYLFTVTVFGSQIYDALKPGT